LLHRNSIVIEIIRDLENIIRSKIDVENLEIIERNKGKYRYVTLEYINKKMST